MTYKIESGKTVGIYVPSCKRYDNIITANTVGKCTYVVRESEKDKYRDALPLRGGVKIISVKDDCINSLGKVRQWIIDNSKEDIVIQLDDDIEFFAYGLKNNYETIKDKDVVLLELLRVAQIIDDLNLGMASLTMTIDVRKRSNEFIFKGVTGIVNWFNKECIKGKYETEIIKVDLDFMLQELLLNRIIIIPDYLAVKGSYDKNTGGNNTNKTKQRIIDANNYLKIKWGKYFDFNYKSNQSKVLVNR